MLSISNVSSRQAKNYYAADDYYTEGHPTGFWHGNGSQALGLEGFVTPEQLNPLLDGELPNGDVIHQGGGLRRAATDLTFSAPKSVSIQALIGGDERLFKAQERAVKAALDYAESFIGARETDNGETRFKITNNAVFAVVQHDTSRAGDPNLHHHCLLLNCTKRSDGKWRAFENRKLFEQKTVLDAIYTSFLQKECRNLGYEVRQTATSFELGHISREQILHFSKRAKAIEDGLEIMGLNRSTATSGERQFVTLQSRGVKERYDRTALQKEWNEQARTVGFNNIPEVSIKTSNVVADKAPHKLHHKQVKMEVELVINHLAEREASFSKNQIVVGVLRHGKGDIEVEQIEKVLTNKQNMGEIVLSKDGKQIATAKSLAYERRILEIERVGRNQVAVIGWKHWLDKETRDAGVTRVDGINLWGRGLNSEQFGAVAMVLETTNRIVGIQGYAGTGKTTTLKSLDETCKVEGYEIIGLAPSHSAVKALGESGIKGQTLQSWISNRQAREELSSKSIILIDEAGLVPAKQMKIALERAIFKDARVILVGDIKQYQGVEAGKPFAQLQNAGMETVVIHKMLRQKETNLAEAAKLAVTSPQEALQKLEVLEIKDNGERYSQIAKDFVRGVTSRDSNRSLNSVGVEGFAKVGMSKDLPTLTETKKHTQEALIQENLPETLILCGTNQAREQINHAVRKELGLLGQGENYKVFAIKDLTSAEKKRLTSYEVGNVIRFEREYQSLGVKKGEYLCVGAIADTHIVLTDNKRKKVEFAPLKFSDSGFSVGRVEQREMAVGEWVKLTATTREGTNGERAWVEAINKQDMVLKTVSGKQLVMKGEEILPLDYAYASTGHSAQGLGARRVLMEKESGSITTNQRSFYTDLTRAKEEVRLYTNDTKALPVAISRQVEKATALEVTRPRYRELESLEIGR